MASVVLPDSRSSLCFVFIIVHAVLRLTPSAFAWLSKETISRRNYRIYDMLNFNCVSGLCVAAFRNFAEAMVFHNVPQPKTDTGEAADTHLQDLCYIGGPRANLGVAVP